MNLTALIIGGAAFIIAVGGASFLVKMYRKVNQGEALIINKIGVTEVTFAGGVVLPIVYRGEVMDISVKTVEIARSGTEGLICQDNIRADIKVTFFVKVNKTKEDVLKVAQNIGCVRASDIKTLEELFVAKFSEALKTVGKRLDFEQLYTQRDDFKDQIIDVIGKDLNGYVLEDAAIDYLEQTPIEMLDKDNILDSAGIRKITQITAAQHVLTNDLRQNERKAITKQNLEADEAILELDRRRADAEAKQQREIETVKARERAETLTVQAEESRRAEIARLKAEEEIAIADLNKQRQVEVADKDRERVVAIKTEQVEKDRQLEVISRTREVDLQEIDKQKALEIKKKEIADVIRTRIAVDKNVAEEEERIKDLRATAEATRNKDVRVITAEAAAEELLVKDLKAAEASEKAAEFAAREKLVAASASLEASDKEAAAKIRLAEGRQAEVAADGLAEVKVKEANALAIEKEGRAEASVSLLKMEATATGGEKQGLAKVAVRRAEVEVKAQDGEVVAAITRAQMKAEAEGAEEKGLAAARVLEAEAAALEKQGHAEAIKVRELLVAEAAGKEADAAAVEKQGVAQARAILEKMTAEATGLAEKAKAMNELQGHAREHEEFRLKLEKTREIQLAEIAVRKDIAVAQASVMSEAFSSADIKIVGGDGSFFDQFVKAASMGHSIDSFVQSSDTIQSAFGGYLSGDSDLGADLTALAGQVMGDGENLKNLSITALLSRMMLQADGPLKAQISGLLDRARQLEGPATDAK